LAAPDLGGPTYPLDVVAALPGDRKTFIPSVVNPTEDSQEFAPQITGVKLRGPGTLSQIAAPSVTAMNEAGKEPVVKIVETPKAALSEKVQVPPISVSVYEFEIENAWPLSSGRADASKFVSAHQTIETTSRNCVIGLQLSAKGENPGGNCRLAALLGSS
jgi:hypothetical protein